MSTRVKCNNINKDEIRTYVSDELKHLMSMINESEDSIVIKDTDEGLEIAYPIGEIYGYASDYVECVKNVFSKLKSKYLDVAINGVAYEYETTSPVTYGPYFYCEEKDKELHVSYDWQECVCCGKIGDYKAYYNSSQRDFEEGNLLCLCSPTCALEYSLDKNICELEVNDSLTEKEREAIYESDDTDKVLKKTIFKRISKKIERNAEDFMSNKERIVSLMNRKGITASQKKVLASILELKDIEAKKEVELIEVDEIDFEKGTFVVTGFEYEDDICIRQSLELRKANVKSKVSNKIDYLIVPDGDVKKNSNYTKAEELIANGAKIAIVAFSKFKELLYKHDEAIYGKDGAEVLEKFQVTLYDDEVCVDAYIGDVQKEVVIPMTFMSCPITKIGPRCFSSNVSVSSMINKIVLPDTVKEIGDEAFSYCKSLETLSLPKQLEVIGMKAFAECNNLTKIDFPKTLKEIGKQAFARSGIKDVYIPSSVIQICESFTGCNNLETIVVDENNVVYDSRDNANAIIETASNKLVSASNNTTIPSSIEIIGESAFSGLTSIDNLVIPNGIKEIGRHAFSMCTSLKSIEIADSVEKIGNFAFSYTPISKIKLPNSLKTIHVAAFSNCNNFSEIIINDGLEEIEDIDKAWMYNCKISKVYGSSKSNAKDIALKRKAEYIEIE